MRKYEKNIVEPRRPQTTIRPTRIVCWVRKAKNSHWECIILIACPLHEHASLLRYSTMPVLFSPWFEFKHSVAVKIGLLHLPLFTKSNFHFLIIQTINLPKCATRRFSKTSSSLRADSTSVFDVLGRPAKSSSWKSIRPFRTLWTFLRHAAFSLRHRHTRPLVRQLAVGLSSRRHVVFNPKSVRVRVLVDSVAHGTYFSPGTSVCCVGIISPMLRTHLHLHCVLTYLLTHSMEQSPSWEANRFLASQEIPRILWKPKVH